MNRIPALLLALSLPAHAVTIVSTPVDHSVTFIVSDRASIVQQPTIVNALANGSFEATAVAGYAYAPTDAAWTFDAASGLSGNGTAFTDPLAAPDGAQVAFLQGTGSVTQSFSIVPGLYRVTFSASQRGNFPQPAQSITVSVDGVVVGSVTPGAAYGPFASGGFVLMGDTPHILRLQGTQAVDSTAFVDDVKVATP